MRPFIYIKFYFSVVFIFLHLYVINIFTFSTENRELKISKFQEKQKNFKFYYIFWYFKKFGTGNLDFIHYITEI